jgi:hypothetical protein
MHTGRHVSLQTSWSDYIVTDHSAAAFCNPKRLQRKVEVRQVAMPHASYDALCRTDFDIDYNVLC